jgi:hypothetical protein
MRLVHPAALVGLLLNFARVWMLFSNMENIVASQLSDQDPEILEAVISMLPTVRMLFIGLLLFQALALGLIATGVGFGSVLALVAGFFMLPESIIYCIGALLSRDRVKYAAFAEASPDCAKARLIFRSQDRKKCFFFAGASLVLFVLFLLAGWEDQSVVFFGLALAGLFLALRATRYHALALHDDYFTLTPGIFSRRLLLPYSSVSLATLFDNESIHFQVQRPEGTAVLAWSLRTVVPEERRAALEELGAVLSEHGVPLQ